MTKNKIRLGDLFSDLDLVGDHSACQNLEVSRLQAVELAKAGDLAFVAQDSYLKDLPASKASAFVVSQSLWEKATALKPEGAVFLRSKDAMLAFAKVSGRFSTEEKAAPGVHPSAAVHPDAQLGKNVSVGAHAVVAQGARVGDDSILYPSTYVGERAELGKGVVLFPGAVVYQDSILGDRVRVHSNSVIGADGFGYVQEKTGRGVRHVKIHHTGRVRIGNDVEIGAGSSIDRGTLGETVLGNGCIIDNQVQIGHNCQLGEGVIVCGNTGIAGSVKLENFAVVGGMVGISNKVVIGAGAIVTAFSAVSRSVPPGQVHGGVPSHPWKETLKLRALVNRLPELFEVRKKEQ